VATDLQTNKNASDAVEPSLTAQREPSLITRFESRLQTLPFGRHTLSCLQWCVVGALVLSGFYGAEAINSGVELAMRADTTNSPQIIVAAAAPTAAK
jgi:hypothetical protein